MDAEGLGTRLVAMCTSTYSEALAFSDSAWQLVNDCWPWRRGGGDRGPARGIAGGEGPPWGSACGSEHDKGTPKWLRRRARRTEMRWKMRTLTTRILIDSQIFSYTLLLLV